MKCTIIDLFDVSWGKVAILEFPESVFLKIGDKLKNENNNFYKIIGVSVSKAPIVEKYNNRIHSNIVFDCTVQPIDHHDVLTVGDVLELS